MGCRSIDIEKICLDKGLIKTLCCASGDDKILFVDQTLFCSSCLKVAAIAVFIGDPNASIHKVKPAKYLFGPKLKSIQKLHIRAIGKGHFFFTKSHKPIHCSVIIVNSWVCNEIVYAIHFHRYFPANRNFTSHDSFSELAVVFRSSGVRERHLRNLACRSKFFVGKTRAKYFNLMVCSDKTVRTFCIRHR